MTTTTVATIQDLLAAGRIMEAKALLISAEASFAGEELRGYASEIEQRLTQAKALVARAVTLERAGKVAEAKALYESVLPLAADLPGIGECINRTNEALLLTRAVQRRSARVRRSRPAPPAKTGARFRIVWMGLGVGLAAAILALTLVEPQSPPPEQRMEAAPAPADTQRTAPEPLPPSPPAHDSAPPASPAPPPTAQPPPAPPPSAPVEAPPPPTAETLPAATAETQPAAGAAEQREPPPPPPAQRPPQTPEAKAPAALPPPATTPASRPPIVLYTVRQGDSLISIARNELCNAAAWQQVYQRNRDQIADPNKVMVGMALRLGAVDNRCRPAPQPSSQADRRISPKGGGEEKTRP